MMLQLTVALALGAISPGSARASEQDAPGLTELKTAAAEVAMATGYRFDSRTNLKTMSLSVVLAGEYARAKPIHLEGDGLEAFRLARKVAHRNEDGDWELQEGPPALVAPHVASDGACWVACVLPAPHELLKRIETDVTQIKRGVGEGGTPATQESVVFEGQLNPASIHDCLKPLGDPRELDCRIRITMTTEGEIEAIDLEARRKTPASGSSIEEELRPPQSQAADLAVHYRLRDVNQDVEVEVPEEAQELLVG